MTAADDGKSLSRGLIRDIDGAIQRLAVDDVGSIHRLSEYARLGRDVKAVGAGGTDIVDPEIVDDPTEPRENAAAGAYRGDGDDSSTRRTGPTAPRPGTGLMTFEDANRLAHEANLRAGVYDKKYRRK